MPKVAFTGQLQRFLPAPAMDATGDSVRAVLDDVRRQNPRLGAYVLDEQGALRKHVTVFVGDRQITDRLTLSDPVGPAEEVYVLQALSGGSAFGETA